MSKSKRAAVTAAREALAAQRRAEERRRRLIIAGTSVGAVIVLIAVLVIIKLTAPAKVNTPTTSADPAVIQKATTVPAATFDAVGAGTPKAVPIPVSGKPPLTADGKPLVLYVGAEYCPYCAAERWALTAALSRFGTFSGLKQTASSASDVFPSTQTLSFYGSTYTSDLISFQGVEAQDVDHKALQPLTDAQQQNFIAFDGPPYVSSDGAQSFPFINFGNIALQIGASYDAGLLQGKSALEIATALQDPNSEIAKSAIGTANAFTAAICAMTGGNPGAVCNSAAVAPYKAMYGG